MHIDLYVAIAGLIVGFVVGLTGMGGGALMTPILVLLFKVEPLTAVSSDLVAALVMKPVGGAVHMRRGTVNLRLVRWLMIGPGPERPLAGGNGSGPGRSPGGLGSPGAHHLRGLPARADLLDPDREPPGRLPGRAGVLPGPGPAHPPGPGVRAAGVGPEARQP